MSSTADSLKQPAPDSANEEPSSKKVKLTGSDTTNKGGTEEDVKNGTTATERINLENSKNNNNNINKTPTKVAANGNKGGENVEEDDDDADDDDEDGGANLDGVFDPKTAKSLQEVEDIQTELFNLNEKASEEILKVEQKFNKLRRPHFEKRNELLKEIPNFWLTSLANHPTIAPMIESAEDEDCLHYMVNLDVEEFEDIKSGYKLKLHFVENPYITNKVIIKEFQVDNSEEVLSSSTPIEYKDTPQGKSLKQVVETSIAQSRRARRPGHIQQSFFAWLVEGSDSGQDEIADILKDQIWPNPLELFFATPEEDYEVGSDDESDEDEELDGEEGIIAEEIEISEEEIEGEEEDDDDDEEDGDGEGPWNEEEYL